MILENYICSILLIVLGIYTLLVKKNLIKMVIGIGIIIFGINLLIVTIGFNSGGTAPIFSLGEITQGSFFVDPVSQAMALIIIVIGVCFTALLLSLIMKLYEKHGTLNADRIRRLRG